MTNPDHQMLTLEEIRTLEGLLAKLSKHGTTLPWPLFRFITEVAATVNVDLLVHDEARGVLLAWRDDPFGSGWHVPGSIIRHREEIAHRISACASEELGCDVEASDRPVAIIQIFDDRGHSVSLCYRATLQGSPGKRLLVQDEKPQPGDLHWFASPPEQIYPSHLIYSQVIEASRRGGLGDGARVFTQHTGRRDAAQAAPEGTIDADVVLR